MNPNLTCGPQSAPCCGGPGPLRLVDGGLICGGCETDMARHKQSEIGRLSSSTRQGLSTADKEDLLKGLRTGPWRGPDEVIASLERTVGPRCDVVRGLLDEPEGPPPHD